MRRLKTIRRGSGRDVASMTMGETADFCLPETYLRVLQCFSVSCNWYKCSIEEGIQERRSRQHFFSLQFFVAGRIDKRPNPGNTFESGFITGIKQFIYASQPIPTNVSYLRTNHEVGHFKVAG